MVPYRPNSERNDAHRMAHNHQEEEHDLLPWCKRTKVDRPVSREEERREVGIARSEHRQRSEQASVSTARQRDGTHARPVTVILLTQMKRASMKLTGSDFELLAQKITETMSGVKMKKRRCMR